MGGGGGGELTFGKGGRNKNLVGGGGWIFPGGEGGSPHLTSRENPALA